MGLAAVLVFMGGIFLNGREGLKAKYASGAINVLVALMGAFFVFIIDEIKISYLRSANLQQFVWIIFALIVAASRIIKNRPGDYIQFWFNGCNRFFNGGIFIRTRIS